jgi:hypothetical protein
MFSDQIFIIMYLKSAKAQIFYLFYFYAAFRIFLREVKKKEIFLSAFYCKKC